MPRRRSRIAVAIVVAAAFSALAAPDALAIDIAPQPVTDVVVPVTAAVPDAVPVVPEAAPPVVPEAAPVQAAPPAASVVAPVAQEVERVVAPVVGAAPATPTPTPTNDPAAATAPTAPRAAQPAWRDTKPQRAESRRSAGAKPRAPILSDKGRMTVDAADAVAPAQAAEAAGTTFPMVEAKNPAASASPSNEPAPGLPRLPDLPSSFSIGQSAGSAVLLVFAALAIFFLGSAASQLMVPLRLVPELARPTRLFSRLERPG